MFSGSGRIAPEIDARSMQSGVSPEMRRRDTRATFESVRRLSHDLHPATLRVLGLVPAIKTHCTEVMQRHNVQDR